MVAAAFHLALPLSARSWHGRAQIAPRPSRATAAAPSSARIRAVASAPVTRLRERSVVALRGLSDAAWVAMMHEVGVRAVVGCSAACATFPETELALGGLVGIWTAAAVAARLRRKEARAVSESAALADDWSGALRGELTVDEVGDVIAWLSILDELEGLRAAQLLWEVARSPDINMRIALADAIAANPVRCNAVGGVLHLLTRDEKLAVRLAAESARLALVEDGVLRVRGEEMPPPMGERETRERLAMVLAEEKAEREEDADMNAWLCAEFARAVDELGERALARASERSEMGKKGRAKRPRERQRLHVPLFDGLKWSEIHGLCTIAALPLAYEVYGLLHGANLPLRFVGLGWLLAVGGLVAYPRSGALWQKLQFACAMDADQYRQPLQEKGFVEWK